MDIRADINPLWVATRNKHYAALKEFWAEFAAAAGC